MKRFTISQVSEFLNISNELLRHYERLGLIAPERMENGYRYYTDLDLNKLQGIRRFRNLGFSLSEIDRLMLSADRAECSALLTDAAERIHRERVWQEELDRCVAWIAEDWRLVPEKLNCCELTESPDVLRVSMRVNDTLSSPQVAQDASEWSARMPVVFISPRFPMDGIISGSKDIAFGYGVEMDVFDRLGLRHLPTEKRHPAGPAVMTYIESFGDAYISCASLRHAYRYILDHGWSLTGDAWGVTIGNCLENGVPHRFHRVYLPVSAK